MLAPIVLFVYNRPWHTQQTVEALLKNDLASESELYIFADGEKLGASMEQKEKISEVRDYIHSIVGFKDIHIEESAMNKGLANSVIIGVTKVIEKFGCAIVLEDDVLTHPFFLQFMNEALKVYENDWRLFMVSGCNYDVRIPWWYYEDVYIAHRSCSTGWGTWKDRWRMADWSVSDFETFRKDTVEIEKFNRGGEDMFPMLQAQMDKEIDSWAIRWDYCMYKNDAYCLRTIKTLVTNIGFDGSGVHSGIGGVKMAPYYDRSRYRIRLKKQIKANRRIEKAFKEHYDMGDNEQSLLFKKIKKTIKRFFIRIGVE